MQNKTRLMFRFLDRKLYLCNQLIKNRMRNSLSETAPLVKIAVGLMAGIVMEKFMMLSFTIFPLLVGVVLLAGCLWRYERLQSAVLVLSFVVLGAVLMQRAQQETPHVSRLDRSKTYFLEQRARLLDRLSDHGVDGSVYAVVAAMALGDKSQLTKDLKDTYAVTGASHILALSGLHLGIIYTLLSLLLSHRRWQVVSQVVIIVCIWLYVFLVGMSASVVRSAVMVTVYALLSLGHRDKLSVNTLAFAAIVMLLFNPLSLFDVGFQLSFMAVLAILLFYPLFENLWSQPFLLDHRVFRWLWTMLAVSCAAQIGVAPLIAYYFGRFSCYFLLANLVVVPAAALILYLSLSVLLIPSLAYLLIYIVDTLNQLLVSIAALPGASIEGLHPTLLQVSMVYVVIAAVYLLVDRLRLRGTIKSGRGW
jgi:competence protein ComEC